jgi:predicted helicase
MEFVILLFITIWGITGLKYLIKFKNTEEYENPLWKDLMLIKMRLQLMNSREFEVFCGELLMLLGYNVIITKTTRDEGKDIVIYNTDKSETFVECKLYDEELNSIISRPIAQKLVGAMRHEEVMKNIKVNGTIITTSRFTDEAKEYCDDMGIIMINTNKILDIVQILNMNDVLCAAGLMPSNVTENNDNKNRELTME